MLGEVTANFKLEALQCVRDGSSTGLEARGRSIGIGKPERVLETDKPLSHLVCMEHDFIPQPVIEGPGGLVTI